MILTNRQFTRREPDISAKSLYIFCEGKKREYQYFQYFQGIDSKINIVVHSLEGNEDNSPTGLYEIALKQLVQSESNPSPEFEFLDGDEAWFVIDTDTWGNKIDKIHQYCADHLNWHIAQSNPCFEVWLYYHVFNTRAGFEWTDICDEWKFFLSNNIPGGFNSKRHPIYIETAIENASRYFISSEGKPDIGTTDVLRLGKVIYAVCKWKIEHFRNRI